MAVRARKEDEQGGDAHCDHAEEDGTPRVHRGKQMNRLFRTQPQHLTRGICKRGCRKQKPEAWTSGQEPGERGGGNQ